MKISMRGLNFLGFTLIELMIVIAIIGIMAATAVPIFSKYIRKSKTAEASLNIRKLYDGEIAYIQEEKTDAAGGIISKQFVGAGPTPTIVANLVPGIQKQVGDWSGLAWGQLKFAPDGPVQYVYEAIASGTGTNSAFSACAYGDMDGDFTTSLFMRTGALDSAGQIQGGGGIYTIYELE